MFVSGWCWLSENPGRITPYMSFEIYWIAVLESLWFSLIVKMVRGSKWGSVFIWPGCDALFNYFKCCLPVHNNWNFLLFISLWDLNLKLKLFILQVLSFQLCVLTSVTSEDCFCNHEENPFNWMLGSREIRNGGGHCPIASY